MLALHEILCSLLQCFEYGLNVSLKVCVLEVWLPIVADVRWLNLQEVEPDGWSLGPLLIYYWKKLWSPLSLLASYLKCLPLTCTTASVICPFDKSVRLSPDTVTQTPPIYPPEPSELWAEQTFIVIVTWPHLFHCSDAKQTKTLLIWRTS